MAEVTYQRLGGAEAVEYVDRLVKLYARVYAEPPYEEGPDQVAEFAAKLPKEMNREGFTLVVANGKSELLGAAYGWTMPSGQWWSSAESEPPAWLREVPKFAVMEWIVDPSRQGKGVGKALITMLLSDRPEPWATLASDPRSAARAMYERAGWHQVGSSKLPWGPPMDLLVLRLPSV